MSGSEMEHAFPESARRLLTGTTGSGAFDPERIRPSAILHSNVAMFNSEQAVRTMSTARISSDVSITTMGVEELIRTFSRSSVSLMLSFAVRTDRARYLEHGAALARSRPCV